MTANPPQTKPLPFSAALKTSQNKPLHNFKEYKSSKIKPWCENVNLPEENSRD